MANRIIPLHIEDEYVRGDGVEVGSAGSGNDVTLELSFSKIWDGLTKQVYWASASGQSTAKVILTPDSEGNYSTVVPFEAKREEGRCRMVIAGGKLSGDHLEKETVSATAYFRVLGSTDWPITAPDLTPSEADQLQKAIEGVAASIPEKIEEHNGSPVAHDPLRREWKTDISTHNASPEAHADIRQDIEAHKGDTTNPHKVTAEQVGAVTPGDMDAALDELRKEFGDALMIVNVEAGKATKTVEEIKAHVYSGGMAIMCSRLNGVPALFTRIYNGNAYFQSTEFKPNGDIFTVETFVSGTDASVESVVLDHNTAEDAHPYMQAKFNAALAKKADKSYTDQKDAEALQKAKEYADKLRGTGYAAACHDEAASPTSEPNTWYIPKTMPKPSGEVGMMVDVLWKLGRVDGLGYDVSLVWGEPGGADNEVIVEAAGVSSALTGEYSIPAEGTVRYQLIDQSGRKRWQYVSGQLIPRQYSTDAEAATADKPVHGLQLGYLPGMEIFVQLDKGNSANLMRLVPDEGATLPVYGNGVGAKTGALPAGYILHLKNAGAHWQIINQSDGHWIEKELYTATAPEAVEKVVTLPGGGTAPTPADGQVLLIQFADGSTSDRVTLKIGSGSWQMARNPWRYSDLAADCPVGEIPAGHTCLVHLSGPYAYWEDCGYRPLVSLMEKQFGFDMMKLIQGERQEKQLTPEQYPLAEEIEHLTSQIGEVYAYFESYKALIRLSNFNSSPTYFRFNAIDQGREFIFNYDKTTHTVSAYQLAMAPMDYVNQTFANALRGTASGLVVAVDDVSPVKHEVGCVVESENIAFDSVKTTTDNTTVRYYLKNGLKVETGDKLTLVASAPVALEVRYVGKTSTPQVVYDSAKHTFTIKDPGFVYFNFYKSSGLPADFTSMVVRGEYAGTERIDPVPDLKAVKVTRAGRNLSNVSQKSYFNTAFDFKLPFILPAGKYTVGVLGNSNSEKNVIQVALRNKNNSGVGFAKIDKGKWSSSVISTVDDVVKVNVYAGADYSDAVGKVGEFEQLIIASGSIQGLKFEEYTGVSITPAEDGTVSGMTSLSPTMTILTDTPGVTIDAQYNRDINKAFAKLEAAILSTGGNV